MNKPVDLTAHSGRIQVSLLAEWVGPDLLVKITGGDSHIGSVAFVTAGNAGDAISAPGHRESELAIKVAAFLQDRLNCAIAVVAGIHYDCITKPEIDTVYSLTFSLIEQFIRIQEGLANADNEKSGRI